MTRTLTPEELTAHLTDEQRRIIREGTEAAQRMRDAVAEALPAIVEAERVAEENAVRERDGDSAVSGWFEAAGAEAGPIADACADSLSTALRNTGHTTEALVSNLYPERDDAA